ncbi:MAG: hypothetical protein ABI855_04435 [Bacteroidota bacterium]
MNLIERKLLIIEAIIRINKNDVIKQIEKIISGETDFWDELTDEQKASIDRGLKQLKEGKRIPLAKVKKKLSKWVK